MIDNLKQELKNILEDIKEKAKNLVLDKASSNLIKNIKIPNKGNLQSLALISVKDEKTLEIKPFQKDNINLIEKALYELETGTVLKMSSSLLFTLSDITQEVIYKYIKLFKDQIENSKIRSRLIRQNYFKDLKNNKNESEVKRLEKLIDLEINEFNKNIDDLFKTIQTKYKWKG